MASERLDVFAQGRDLERPPSGDDGDGAVLDAGGHRLEAGGLDPADHFVRMRGGGDVDVAERLAEQRIAHRAADHARLLAGAVERAEKIAKRRRSQPCGIEAAQDLRHLVSPGTNWPSSIWAGM